MKSKPSSIKSVAVFCGSASGQLYDYQTHCFAVGRALSKRGIRVIFGGGRVGLMGAVANGCLSVGGEIIGIMPRALVDREIAHNGLTELQIVDNMHTRKALMADSADAFMVLPGGCGTLEEFFEQWTWAQIGTHEKAIGLLNINCYFDSLLFMVDHMQRSGFLSDRHRAMIIVEDEIDAMLAKFDQYEHPLAKQY